MQAILMGNGILQLPRKHDLLKFKHGMWDFWPVCWESVKPYQTIEYALLILSVPCNFFLVNKRGIRESYEEIAGCQIFVEKEQECRIRTLSEEQIEIGENMCSYPSSDG